MIVLGFVSYFFTLNIGKAAAKYVAEYKATGETDKISDVVSATLIMGFVIGLASVGLIALFGHVFVSDVLRIDPSLQQTAKTALYLGCANILVLMLGLTFQFILQGLQRFDRYLLITNLTSLLLSLGSLVVVISGYGVIGLFVVSLSVSIVTGIISLVLVKRLLPTLEFRLRVGREAWSEVWRYGLSIMAYQLFGSLLLLFERAWITRQFGPEALTFYTIPMALAIYLQMFVASLVLAMFPVVNEHLSQPDILVRLYKKSTKFVLMIIALAIVSAIAGGRAFLALWLNEDFAAASYHLLVIHVLAVSLVGITMIVWQIAEAFRNASLTAFANFLLMALGIPLMIIFSYQWQTAGVAYGRLLAVLVYVPLIFYVERRFLGGIFWNFWGSTCLRILVAGIAAFFVESIIMWGFETGWLVLFLSLTAGTVVYGIVLLLSGSFDSEDKLILKSFLGRENA